MNNVDTHIISTQDMKAASVLCGRKRGYSSRLAEMIASIWTNYKKCLKKSQFDSLSKSNTSLSNPRKNSIRKNMIAQNWGNGSIPIASGYVINAKAGPPVATDDTGIPVTSELIESLHLITLHFCIWNGWKESLSLDINPSTENTTNPAKMLVAQFTMGTMIASLQIEIQKLKKLWLQQNIYSSSYSFHLLLLFRNSL